MLSMTRFNLVAGLGNHGHKNITITNNLGEGKFLTLDCKSKQFDIGVSRIKPNGVYAFQIKPNFLGTTLFFCKAQWDNLTYWFDVYKYKRDKNDGPDYSWTVDMSGACLHKKDNTTDCQWFV